MKYTRYIKNIVCFLCYIAFMLLCLDFKEISEASESKVLNDAFVESQQQKDKSKSKTNVNESSLKLGNKNVSSVNKEGFSKKAAAKNKVQKQISPVDYIASVSEKDWEYAQLLDRYIVKYDSESYVVLTIRPKLQELLDGVLNKYNTRMAAAIIQDPFTGEILAMSSSNKNKVIPITDSRYKTDNWALKAAFPIASIIKIITASAGFDNEIFSPNSSYLADGKRYMKVWKAFAISHNGVFGRLGRQIGKEKLEAYMDEFGFNKPFFFDLPVGQSVGVFPIEQRLFEQACAGLNRNFMVSPIHVSAMVSAIVNRGTYMKPFLADYAVRSAKRVFKRNPFALSKPIKPSTAALMRRMMYATTAVGTGKRGFGGYKQCPKLAKYCAGKTGTLTGSYPKYLYTWFSGFTNVSGNILTITTLVGQPDNNGTKAPSIAGQIAYEMYMKHQEENTSDVMACK